MQVLPDSHRSGFRPFCIQTPEDLSQSLSYAPQRGKLSLRTVSRLHPLGLRLRHGPGSRRPSTFPNDDDKSSGIRHSACHRTFIEQHGRSDGLMADGRKRSPAHARSQSGQGPRRLRARRTFPNKLCVGSRGKGLDSRGKLFDSQGKGIDARNKEVDARVKPLDSRNNQG